MFYNGFMVVAGNVLKKFIAEKSSQIELDFGLSKVNAHIESNYIIIDNKQKYLIETKIKDKFCYLLKDQRVIPIIFFDQQTKTTYKLVATKNWPTICFGSVPMHKVTGFGPKEDTANKMSLLKPKGICLDTCMGLGYSAIAASATADKVYSCERDENVFIVAKLNPFSRKLFKSKKIKVINKDVENYIDGCKKLSFDSVIHDPPTFTIAPRLYHKDFYKKIYRVLKPKGKMFHYTPFYAVRRGVDFASKIRSNLKAVGFKITKYNPDKGGLVCQK